MLPQYLSVKLRLTMDEIGTSGGYMRLMPQGDHYVWYCDWCDTRNVTLWVRIERNELCCAACQKTFPVHEQARPALGAGTEYYQLL